MEEDTDDLWSYRVVSIDPGSQLVGFTLWEVDIRTLAIRIIHCWTQDVRGYEKTISRDIDNIELRLAGLKCELRRLFKRFKPHAVSSESNFLQKKRVTGYRGLLLTLSAIKEELYYYDPLIELDIVHVIKAKEFMEAKSNSKEDVHKKVGCIPDVIYPDDFNVEVVGPDGRDSIALGYCYIKSHWEQLNFAHQWYVKNN